MKTLPSERGQAIVLIVIAIIGLFGAAALAIDLGQVYSARRGAQNAADAAALAAAYEASAGSKVVQTAVDKGYEIAATNGYNNDTETNWVRVENGGFTDGPYCRDCPKGQVDNPLEYYEAQITVRLQPIFAQLIFNGMEQVTVNAIAHATTAEDASAGNAILSVNTGDDSMVFNGTIDINVTGGSIRSDGGMTKTGASGEIYVDESSGGIWYARGDAPKQSYVYTDPKNKNNKTVKQVFTGAKPYQQAAPQMNSIQPPDCPTSDADVQSWQSENDIPFKETNGVKTYYYSDGLTITNLPAGIHCVNSTKTGQTYKDAMDKGTYTGSDVLIVLLHGGIKQTGGDSFNLLAATDMKDAKGNQWGGMVFYIPSDNTSVLQFGGNSVGYLQGTVYAPGATCDFGGNPDGQAIHSAIICNKFRDHGNGTLQVIYKPEEQFHFPPLVELIQ